MSTQHWKSWRYSFNIRCSNLQFSAMVDNTFLPLLHHRQIICQNVHKGESFADDLVFHYPGKVGQLADPPIYHLSDYEISTYVFPLFSFPGIESNTSEKRLVFFFFFFPSWTCTLLLKYGYLAMCSLLFRRMFAIQWRRRQQNPTGCWCARTDPARGSGQMSRIRLTKSSA